MPLDDSADGTVAGGCRRTACSSSSRTSSRSVRASASGPTSRSFVTSWSNERRCPLVLDADALNALASDPDRSAERRRRITIDRSSRRTRAKWRVWRNTSVDEVQASRLDVARDFAVTASDRTSLLKGYPNVDRHAGRQSVHQPAGNPGMATGGTGDVLTGVLAAWLAQLLDAEAACKIAVYLHALAGDLTEADEGEWR